MSDIIIPSGEDIDALSRRERKQFEREQRNKALSPYQQVRVKDLPPLVAGIVDPALAVAFRENHRNNLLINTLKDVLLDKGVLTEEELDQMFQTKIAALQTGAQPETPNSPALAEARAASESGAVQRLDEPERPMAVTEDQEAAPRRLVEG